MMIDFLGDSMEFLSFVLLFLGFLSAGFLWNFGKKDEFLENESERCLNNFCEISGNWNSEGRVYTNGLTFTKDKTSGEINFVKQAKLCDIGLLK